jgi:transketolase
MRTAFINELTSQAGVRDNVFLLVGDLGFSVVEEFADRYPDRFLNVGVAEQNLTGIAAGLASEGYHVFTYSIANFPTLRCLEQIRNDVCYHNLPVTVVAVGSGLAYGNLGYSHHGVQDIAALGAMPNLRILSPADPSEAKASLDYLLRNPGPGYLRLGKAGEAVLHEEPFQSGGVIPVRTSGVADTAILATGSVLREALLASELLAADGLRVDVFSCPLLKPLNGESFAAVVGYRRLVTLEEHSPAGGLGDIVRRLMPSPVPVVSLGIREDCAGAVGDQNYLRRISGLDGESVAAAILADRAARPVT